MKQKLLIGTLIGAVVLTAALFFVFHSHGSSGEVMPMAKNGATESELLATVEKSSGPMLSSNPADRAEQVIEMHKAGVPDTVIITMLRKSPPVSSVAKK